MAGDERFEAEGSDGAAIAGDEGEYGQPFLGPGTDFTGLDQRVSEHGVVFGEREFDGLASCNRLGRW